MTLLKTALHYSLGTLVLFTNLVDGKEIWVRAHDGEEFAVHIQPEESFCDVVDKIGLYMELSPEERDFHLPQYEAVAADYSENHQDVCLDYMVAGLNIKSMGKSVAPVNIRDYNIPPTQKERDMIAYIVTTLSYKKLTTVLKEKSTLETYGDKIDNLHPFRFCEVIFTDEKLKAAVANLKGKAFVWPRFKKGLFDTLTAESKKQNLKLPAINDFAKKVGINSELIIPSLNKGNWDEFLDILIEKVPREGNPGKYNM